jgi:hypothetical protein
LVRPDRILSPITRSAATALGVSPLSVVITTYCEGARTTRDVPLTLSLLGIQPNRGTPNKVKSSAACRRDANLHESDHPPTMLQKLADAEREAEDDMADFP